MGSLTCQRDPANNVGLEGYSEGTLHGILYPMMQFTQLKREINSGSGNYVENLTNALSPKLYAEMQNNCNNVSETYHFI